MFIKKMYVLSALVAISLVSGVGVVSAQAASFVSEETVSITTTQENLYVAGNEVTISSNIKKDASLAGGKVIVKAPIDRNLNVGGGKVVISEEARVGGNLRVAAGQVEIEGDVQDDVIIFAGEATLKNMNINGDLIVSVGSLTLENVTVNGSFTGEYGDYTGEELSTFVAGDIEAKKSADVEVDVDVDHGDFVFFSILGLIGSTIGTIIVAIFLARRKRLHIPSLGFTQSLLWDALWGFGSLILPAAFFIVTLFIGGITLGYTVTAIVYLLGYLSVIFTPIYVGNILYSASKATSNIALWVAGSWFIILIWELLLAYGVFGFASTIFWLPLGLIGLCNYGYIMKKIYTALTTYVSAREM